MTTTTDRDQLREAASSAEYHQRRGMLPDAVDALAQSYDDFMADDRFDAWDMLHKIGKRLRELRDINRDRAALATPTALDPATIECPNSPTGRHQIDTSMEEGPHHCFNCGADMRASVRTRT